MDKDFQSEAIPVQVVTMRPVVEVFSNFAEAKKKYPTLNLLENSMFFTGATRGEVDGKVAARFESWPAYDYMGE